MTHRLSRIAALTALTFAFPAMTFAAGEYLALGRWDGVPGESFDVRGYNFAPDQEVTVTFEGMTRTARADGGGNFATSTFTIPFRLPGFHQIRATQTGGTNATEKIHINGYHPWGGASSYYVLPGQPQGFYGRHFAPYEEVQLHDSAGVLVGTYSADGGGNIDTWNTITAIPWSWKLSERTYRMTGQMTGYTSTFTFVVGHYYPNITPNSYYVPFNAAMTVDARNFAPSEPVNLLINGTIAQTRTADGGGNLLFSINAPGSGMQFEIKAIGQWSGAESIRHVTLAQPGWAL